MGNDSDSHSHTRKSHPLANHQPHHCASFGAEGETVSWQNGEGRVRVKGEIWLARSDVALTAGSRVKIVGRDGLVLRVQDIRPA